MQKVLHAMADGWELLSTPTKKDSGYGWCLVQKS